MGRSGYPPSPAVQSSVQELSPYLHPKAVLVGRGRTAKPRSQHTAQLQAAVLELLDFGATANQSGPAQPPSSSGHALSAATAQEGAAEPLGTEYYILRWSSNSGSASET